MKQTLEPYSPKMWRRKLSFPGKYLFSHPDSAGIPPTFFVPPTQIPCAASEVPSVPPSCHLPDSEDPNNTLYSREAFRYPSGAG